MPDWFWFALGWAVAKYIDPALDRAARRLAAIYRRRRHNAGTQGCTTDEA